MQILKNNLQNSSTRKVSGHILSGFSISSFRSIENKHDVYRGIESMKKISECLREHPIEIINFNKKKIKLLTKQQQEQFENANKCYDCKEKFENKYLEDKKIVVLQIIVIIQGNIEVLHIAYAISNVMY